MSQLIEKRNPLRLLLWPFFEIFSLAISKLPISYFYSICCMLSNFAPQSILIGKYSNTLSFIINQLWKYFLQSRRFPKSGSLSVCYYHVTYAFQSEFTLYSWVFVYELSGCGFESLWCQVISSWKWQTLLILKKKLWTQFIKISFEILQSLI